MQDVPLAKHASYKGKPYLLHDLRGLWFATFCQRHQKWFPGPDWQAQQDARALNMYIVGYICCMVTEGYLSLFIRRRVINECRQRGHAWFSRSSGWSGVGR